MRRRRVKSWKRVLVAFLTLAIIAGNLSSQGIVVKAAELGEPGDTDVVYEEENYEEPAVEEEPEVSEPEAGAETENVGEGEDYTLDLVEGSEGTVEEQQPESEDANADETTEEGTEDADAVEENKDGKDADEKTAKEYTVKYLYVDNTDTDNPNETRKFEEGAKITFPTVEENWKWETRNENGEHDEYINDSYTVAKDLVLFAVIADEASEEDEAAEETEETAKDKVKDAYVEPVVSVSCVDEKGAAIEDAQSEMPAFLGTLTLNNPEKTPILIDGYEYVEASIDGAVVDSLVKKVHEAKKDADEESKDEKAEDEKAEEEERSFDWFYVAGGEEVAIEADTTVVFTYEESGIVTDVTATIVDQFGDTIADKYTDMKLPAFDAEGILALNDTENPPVDKVSVRRGFKVTKYEYVKATIGKEIITSLKQEAAKGGNGYYYSYSVDNGDTWNKIKEDTTVYFEYTDGQRTTFEYDDAKVHVTAVLQHAGAIPEDADFRVTEITSGPAYEAYLKALDKANSERDYSSENTLVYDIAFITVDEESGAEIEVEPTEGAVKISIEFKKAQLSKELSAEESSDVEIKHLPLVEGVKESAGTTLDATGISVKDIIVEDVDNQIIDVDGEAVEFVSSGFSVYTVSTNPDKQAADINLDIMGVIKSAGAEDYGIVATTYEQHGGDTETNMMVGSYYSNAQELGASTNYSNAGGENYFGSVAEGATLKFYQTPANIYLGSTATWQYDNSKFTMLNYNPESVHKNADKDVAGIVSSIASSVGTAVDNSGVKGNANATIYGDSDKDGWTLDQKNQGKRNLLDLTQIKDENGEVKGGTYVVNYSGTAAIDKDNSKFDIVLADNQQLVVNCTESNVEIKNFSINGLTADSYVAKTDKEWDAATTSVIFYCPNATSVSLNGTVGIFVVPQGTVYIDNSSAGILIASHMYGRNGEWHYHNHELKSPDDCSVQFKVKKHVNGQIPAAADKGKFTFFLQDTDHATATSPWTKLQEKTNENGELVVFDSITYSAEGTYHYDIGEWFTEEEDGQEYTYDRTHYSITVVVTKQGNAYVPTVTYQKYIGDGPRETVSEANLVFDNTKNTHGKIQIVGKKHVNRSAATGQEFKFALYGGVDKNYWSGQVTGLFRSQIGSEVKNSGEYFEFPELSMTNSYYYQNVNGQDRISYFLVKETSTSGEFSNVLYECDEGAYVVKVTEAYISRGNYGQPSYEYFYFAPGDKSYETLPVNESGWRAATEAEPTGKLRSEIVFNNFTAPDNKRDEFPFNVTKSLSNWPDGLTFTFKLERLDNDSDGPNNQSTKKGPWPTGGAGQLSADESYMTITVDKNNRTKSFGTLSTNGLWEEKGSSVSGTAYGFGNYTRYHCYMYKITEVDDGVPGVTYDTTPHYIKVWHNRMALPNGLVTEWFEVNASTTLEQCGGPVYPIVMTNTYEEQTTSIAGVKVWEASEEGLAAPELTAGSLYAVIQDKDDPNAQKYYAPIEKVGNTWKFEKNDLPMYKNFTQEIKYQVIGESTTNDGKGIVQSGNIEINGKQYEVSITNDGNIVISNKYVPDKGYLQITKSFRVSDGTVTNLSLKDLLDKLTEEQKAKVKSSIKFVITNNVTSEVKEITLAQFNEDGVYGPEEVLAGTYTVTESGADCLRELGYQFDNSTVTVKTAEVEKDKTATAAFVNDYTVMKGSIKLVKKSDTGKVLKDAEFELYKDGKLFDTYTTDKYGEINVPSLLLGTYVFREKTAPVGYVKDSSDHTFTIGVGENGQIIENAAIEVVNAHKPAKTHFVGDKSFVYKDTNNAVDANKVQQVFTFELKADSENAVMPKDGKVTATVDNAGTFSFGEIEFAEPGEYVYKISETTAGTDNIDVDANAVTVTVKVTEKETATAETSLNVAVKYVKNGQEIGTSSFKNEYHTQGTTSFDVIKTLTGGTLTANDKFEFKLTDNDGKQLDSTATISSLDDQGVGTVTFDYEPKYTEADLGTTFTYYIVELPSGINGVVDDPVNRIRVDVTLEDDTYGETGAIKANKVYMKDGVSGDTNPGFVNDYAVGEVRLHAQKEIASTDGVSLSYVSKAGFEFVLKDANGKVVDTKTTDESGAVTFERIPYQLSDLNTTFKYTIEETPKDGNGITCDTTVQNVTVTLSRKGANLIPAVEYEGGSATIRNTYSSNGNASISGKKILTGRDPKEGETYQVNLTTRDGSDTNTARGTQNAQVVPNSDAGYTFNFAYTQNDLAGVARDENGAATKVFKYTVEEAAGPAGQSMTYSSAKYDVDITVTDNGKGEMTVTVSAPKATDATDDEKKDAAASGNAATGLNFINKYTAKGEAVLDLTKNLTGRNMREGEFTFELRRDGKVLDTKSNKGTGTSETITFDTQYYTQDDVGTPIEYQIVEVNTDVAHVHYDEKVVRTATVTVTHSTTPGRLATSVSYGEAGNVYNNTYTTSGTTTFVVNKSLTGRDTPAAAGEFTFILTDKQTGETYEATNAADGTVKFAYEPEYTEKDLQDPNKKFFYLIEEKIPTDTGFIVYDKEKIQVEVTLEDQTYGTKGEIVATNKYVKVLENNTVTTEDKDTFYNQFVKDGVILNAQKLITDATANVSRAGYTFRLTPQNGAPGKVQEKTTASDGTVEFDEIQYKYSDKGQDYIYIIEEINKPDEGTKVNGVEYTAQPQTVTVQVREVTTETGAKKLVATPVYANNANIATLTNEYTVEGIATISGRKSIEGRPANGSEYTIRLSSTDDAKANTTTTVGEDKSYSFKLEYTQDDLNGATTQTYHYVVEELPSDSAAADHMTYSTAKYDVSVTITDNGDGTMSVVVSDPVVREANNGEVNGKASDNAATEVNFINKYSANKDVEIKLNKVLTGRDYIEAGEFEFVLSEADDNWEPVKEIGRVSTAKGASVQTLQFAELIPFTQDDVGKDGKKYVIKELNKGDEHIAYVEGAVHVTITVAHGEKPGELVPTVIYGNEVADAAQFGNTYTTRGTTTFEVKKELIGRADPIEADEFTFILTDKQTGETYEAKNAADGTVKFDYEPEYTEKDLQDPNKKFYYLIEEKIPTDTGFIVYDEEKIQVEVTLEDQTYGTKGEIAATNKYVKVQKDGTVTEDTKDKFNNRYITGDAVLRAEKQITGATANVSRDGYKFRLTPKNGAPGEVQEKTTANGGIVEFDPINYKNSDIGETYTYTIEEINKPAAGTRVNGVAYTAEPQDVKVTLASGTNEAGNAIVVPTITYATDGATAATLTNDYAIEGVASISGLKNLVGRAAAEGESYTVLLEGDDDKLVERAGGDVTRTVVPGSTYSYVFRYTQADLDGATEKTYTYTVKEQQQTAETADESMTYSTAQYSVTVTIADTGNGTMNVTVSKPVVSNANNGETDGTTTGTAAEGADFINKYDASGETAIYGHKTLIGGALEGNDFEFVLTKPDGTTVSAKNDADGNFAFTGLTYGLADMDSQVEKDFVYTLVETAVEKPYNNLTPNGYTITVHVTDDGHGNLVAVPDKGALETDRVEFLNAKDKQISVTKVWGTEAQNNGMSESVTVQLLKSVGSDLFFGENHSLLEGVEVIGEVTLSTGNWSKEWTGLDAATAEGTEIYYNVVEVEPTGYFVPTYAVEGDKDNRAVTITNEFVQEYIDLKVEKKWDDRSNRYKVRPKSIIVGLYEGDEETDLTGAAPITTVKLEGEGNIWTSEFKNLPKYRNNVEIRYTVRENVPEEGTLKLYTASVERVEGTGTYAFTYKITNGYDPVNVVVQGTKTWDHNGLAALKQPKVIKIYLLANGEKTGKTDTVVVPVFGGDWKYKFEGLAPFDENGVEIKYSIAEEPIANYEVTYGEVTGPVVSDDGKTITYTQDLNNKFTGRTNRIVQKIWDDEDDRDGIRKIRDIQAVQVQLYADGEADGDPVTLNAENKWKHEWDTLPIKNEAGKDIEYTVKEIMMIGDYDIRQDYEVRIDEAGNIFTVTNVHTPELINIEGAKTWNDADNIDGLRPESIIIKLYADGELVDQKEVKAADNWTWKFTDKPKFKAGKVGEPINYTIEEVITAGTVAADVYEIKVDGYNVTNTYIPLLVDIEGVKTWNDNNNADGYRPASIRVNLLADGLIIDTKTVDASTNWKYSFTGLHKYVKGKEVVYTVSEDPVDHYVTTVNGYNIENTYKPGYTSVSGSKVWNDEGNADGIRPAAITVRLYRDGQEVATTQATAAGNWVYSFKDLLINAPDGHKYVYTVTEDGVDGYTATINGFTIVNTHMPPPPPVNPPMTPPVTPPEENTPTPPGEDNNDVLGARRSTNVLGARRQKAVLGARRAPQTGDESKMAAWAMAMSASAAACAAWFGFRKKSTKK